MEKDHCMDIIENDELAIIKRLSYFIIDVDGTMTDSGIYYENSGKELKRFSTRDHVGIMAAHYIGIKIIILTGRSSRLTEKRMEEMNVDLLFQGIKKKKDFLDGFMQEQSIARCNIGYLGDDLNDYAAMQLAGYKACPLDAVQEIKSISNYISGARGGYGVVQDTFKYILQRMNRWDSFMAEIIANGY